MAFRRNKRKTRFIVSCSLSFTPWSRGRKFALSVVMEFLKRHQPCVQKLDKGLAQSEPGHRSKMLRKAGAKSQAINIVFMLPYN